MLRRSYRSFYSAVLTYLWCHPSDQGDKASTLVIEATLNLFPKETGLCFNELERSTCRPNIDQKKMSTKITFCLSLNVLLKAFELNIATCEITKLYKIIFFFIYMHTGKLKINGIHNIICLHIYAYVITLYVIFYSKEVHTI